MAGIGTKHLDREAFERCRDDPPDEPELEQDDGETGRRRLFDILLHAALASATRRHMSTHAHPPLPTFDAGAAEKAAYHEWLGPRMLALSCRERLIYTSPPNDGGRP